ncbi:MAG: MFS transporter, partial [Clostridia bacterium]|nr:MFS transporter [Clostridia bacterium]
ELLPSIIDEFNLSLYQGGLIQTFFNIGGIIALFAMLYFSDLIKKSKLVYYSFLLTSVTLLLIGIFTKSYFFLGLSFALLGGTTKVFDVSVNAFVNDINTKGREFFLQFLHVTFGIGAVLGPVYASLMISRYSWKTAFWVLGLTYAALLSVSIFTMLRHSKEVEFNHGAKNTSSIHILHILKNPQVWIMTFGAACFSGAYVGFVTWFPSYADTISDEFGLLSGIILSLFFMGYVLSRAIASMILTMKNARFLILITSLLGGFSFLLAFVLAQPWTYFVFLISAGFFAGATLPMIIFVACSTFPNNTGGVTTILYMGISVSAMLIPVLMGVIGDKSGIGAAMPVPAILLFASTIVSLLLKKRNA